jgi:diacylglycerol O-acyltransferase / wax synthase
VPLRQSPHIPSLERLSHEDARILGLEAGNICGHTVKILVVEGRHDVDAVWRQLAARIGSEPRLRQRLAPTPMRLAPPAWVDDHSFDLSWHVRAAPSGDDLRRLGSEAMVESLDRSRPLWRIDVAAPVDGERTALVWKVHHCMADGATVMRMATRLLLDSEPTPPPSAAEKWRPAAPPAQRVLFAAAARDRASGLADAGRKAAALDPWRRRWRGLASLPRTLRRELSPSAADSRLDCVAGPRRRVELVSVGLDVVRRIGRAAPAHVTVNDVVLSAVAGGLRRWLIELGASLGRLRVKVPVSLHGADDQFANRDSFMFVDLPVALEDPRERLLAVARATGVRKADQDAMALDTLLHDLARISPSLERRAQRRLMSPDMFTLAVSNVRGPDGPLWVLGKPLAGFYSLADIADRHALRVTVISTAGRLSFGLCADADAVDRLELVAEGIEGELEALLERVA